MRQLLGASLWQNCGLTTRPPGIGRSTINQLSPALGQVVEEALHDALLRLDDAQFVVVNAMIALHGPGPLRPLRNLTALRRERRDRDHGLRV